MTKVQELHEYMQEHGLRLDGLTLGPEKSTPEELAAMILDSLKEIAEKWESGEFEELTAD